MGSVTPGGKTKKKVKQKVVSRNAAWSRSEPHVTALVVQYGGELLPVHPLEQLERREPQHRQRRVGVPLLPPPWTTDPPWRIDPPSARDNARRRGAAALRDGGAPTAADARGVAETPPTSKESPSAAAETSPAATASAAGAAGAGTASAA